MGKSLVNELFASSIPSKPFCEKRTTYFPEPTDDAFHYFNLICLLLSFFNMYLIHLTRETILLRLPIIGLLTQVQLYVCYHKTW